MNQTSACSNTQQKLQRKYSYNMNVFASSTGNASIHTMQTLGISVKDIAGSGVPILGGNSANPEVLTRDMIIAVVCATHDVLTTFLTERLPKEIKALTEIAPAGYSYNDQEFKNLAYKIAKVANFDIKQVALLLEEKVFTAFKFSGVSEWRSILRRIEISADEMLGENQP